MQVTYSVGLLVLFFILLVGEFFIPSGGLIGVAATVVGAASIGVAFTHSTSAGMTVMGVIAITTPLILLAMVKYWPHTPIGRMILNRRPGQIDAPLESVLRSGERRKDLVGKIGIAKTNLLPGGLVIVDGKRVDAVSDGTPIDAGTQVVVINAVAGKIRVRVAGPGDLSPAETEVTRRTQTIEESLESLDLEDEPE